MAEHAAESEPAQEAAPAAAPATSDTGATALALALAGLRSGKTDARLDDFLDKQTRMLELQMEHLHEQRGLQVEHLKHQEKHLRLRYFGDRLRIGLQLLGILAGLAVVSFLAAMAWTAHEDHGVAIEAFSVPPDLAQRGLTGQVFASQLLDRLASLQAKTVTARPASTYANDWGGDIKVEIPETGVSIGELNRYLRQWLGSETRITGEVVRTPAGVSVTARAGATPGATYQGAEADLDGLMQRAAEAIYRETQPYRYAVYLQSTGRYQEAERAYAELASSGAEEDRPWALAGWGSLLLNRGDFEGAAEKGREAMAAAPGLGAGYIVAFNGELLLSHPEQALRIAREADRRLRGAQRRTFPSEPPIMELLGDYRGVVEFFAKNRRFNPISSEGWAGFVQVPVVQAMDLGRDHETTRALRLLSQVPKSTGAPAGLSVELTQSQVRRTAEDWPAVVAAWEARRAGAPLLAAEAYARLGRLQQARALLAGSREDCVDCVIVRGVIAAAARDSGEADRWFARAEALAPSIPAPALAWAQALLEEGDADRAIPLLKKAHARGPHYADPLEVWGEALMRKGDLTGALARFAEADRHAPRWGRNHLRWGEALMLSGRYAEARRQYEIADGLDLSRPDRAALGVLLERTARGPLHG